MLVYLDMDGVLADFDQRYRMLFGQSSQNQNRQSGSGKKRWEQFVLGNQFETLPMYEYVPTMIRDIKSLTDDIQILSAVGGEDYADLVADQKTAWLRDHGIDFPINFVHTGTEKAEYATSNTVLIDDKAYVISAFVNAGGHGIVHSDLSPSTTIKRLKEIFAT